MSRISHPNYLNRLLLLRDVPDIRSRAALLALTTVAVTLPAAQIVIPALGQGRVLHVGSVTGLGSGSGALIAACAILVVAPIVPTLARLVRPADIAMALVALILSWMAWSGLADAKISIERVAAFGLLVDDTYAPVTTWRSGAPFAIVAIALALWRGVVALTRPLHLSAS